uniref:RGS domain-containing protein n=1 Tax=Esox lucius TaxID=8010 RepID=A0AAY5KLK5_ESOLU
MSLPLFGFWCKCCKSFVKTPVMLLWNKTTRYILNNVISQGLHSGSLERPNKKWFDHLHHSLSLICLSVSLSFHCSSSKRILENKALPDLESLLGSKIGQKAFRCFLQSEFSEENLEFWMSCEEYGSTPAGLQGAKARSMYDRFLHPGAPQEVNLDAETREAVLRAQQHVYNLMAKDSYRRFLRSPHCLETLGAP